MRPTPIPTAPTAAENRALLASARANSTADGRLRAPAPRPDEPPADAAPAPGDGGARAGDTATAASTYDPTAHLARLLDQS